MAQSHVVMLVTSLVVWWVLRHHRSRFDRVPLALVGDAQNEALVLQGKLTTGQSALFLVDTAYAGPPVLSLSYLAYLASSSSNDSSSASIATRYASTLRGLRGAMTDDERHRALRHFLQRGRCRSFTSGCTMRLMGIGDTIEAQADMLLCPPLFNLQSDVFVTNPLPGNIHILTMDYLLHRAPCILSLSTQSLQFHAPMHRRRHYDLHLAPKLVGGAFAIPMVIGGATMNIVLDTGAAAGLSLSPDAAERMETCSAPAEPQKALQSGVHGEHVCSDILFASVRIGNLTLTHPVQVFVNSQAVQGADGYAGMGLLRAFDLWLTPAEVGFRISGLRPSRLSSDSLSSGTCRAKQSLRCASSTPPAAGAATVDA